MIRARFTRPPVFALLGALLLLAPPPTALHAKEDEVAAKDVRAARTVIAATLGELTRVAAKGRDFTAAQALAATHRTFAADGSIDVETHGTALRNSRRNRWRPAYARRRASTEVDLGRDIAARLRAVEPQLKMLAASTQRGDRHHARLVRQLGVGIEALRMLHDARSSVVLPPLDYDPAESLRRIAMLETLLEKGARPPANPDTTPWYRHAHPTRAAQQFIWRHETRHDLLHPAAEGLALATYPDEPFQPYVTMGVTRIGRIDKLRSRRRMVLWPAKDATDVPVQVPGTGRISPGEPLTVTAHMYTSTPPAKEHEAAWQVENRLWLREQEAGKPVSRRGALVPTTWFAWRAEHGWVVGLRVDDPLAKGRDYGGNWEWGPGTRTLVGSWRFTTAE